MSTLRPECPSAKDEAAVLKVYALPLGRAVQHTGEIDIARPLESLWVCGKPAHSLDGFTQARIDADGEGGFTLRAVGGFDVQVFGSEPVQAQLM